MFAVECAQWENIQFPPIPMVRSSGERGNRMLRLGTEKLMIAGPTLVRSPCSHPYRSTGHPGCRLVLVAGAKGERGKIVDTLSPLWHT